MSNFATVDDLIKVYGKLSAEQTEKANELLAYVSNYFRYLAKEYNTTPSNITAILWKVKCFILNNAKTKELFLDLRELMAESFLSRENPLTDDIHHV